MEISVEILNIRSLDSVYIGIISLNLTIKLFNG